jgi:hypothetical protein
MQHSRSWAAGSGSLRQEISIYGTQQLWCTQEPPSRGPYPKPAE